MLAAVGAIACSSRRRVWWGAACLALSACTREQGLSSRRAAAVLPSLSVEYGGCESVVEGPVCQVGPTGKLTLWMAEPFASYQLWLGEHRLEREQRVAAGGYQLDVDVDPNARELTLKDARGARFRLALAARRVSPELAEAERAKNAGDYVLARQRLEPVRQTGAPLERLLARGIEARIDLRQGQSERAAAELSRTAEALFQQGQLSDAARDVFARFYLLLQREHRRADASSWLERWRTQIAGFPLGRAWLLDHDALLAFASGDSAASLYGYRQAERAYQRLGMNAERRHAQDEQIRILGELGLLVDAQELHAQLVAPTEAEGACMSAEFYTRRAWLSMLRAEDGDRVSARDVPLRLAESERWERRCGDPEAVLTGLVNRGLWAVHADDVVQLRGVSAEMRQQKPPPDPYLRAWMAELEARIALAERRPERALESWDRERRIGQMAGDWDAQLRARVGAAEAEQAQGRTSAAERSLELAMGLLEQAQELAPLGELAHTHYAARQRAARHLVRSCLARGDVQRAYRAALTTYRAALALQARSTSVRSLDQPQRDEWLQLLTEFQRRRAELDARGAEDWRLNGSQLRIAQSQRQSELEALEVLLDRASKLLPRSADWRALPAPAPGELWLLATPTEQGWTLFGNFAGHVTAAGFDSVASGPTEEVTHPALQPFERELRQATSIRILASGDARAWSFEQWRFDGEPLSRRRLAFSSALPQLAAAAPTGLPRQPLIIADPRGDLPFAAREGELVRAALQAPAARLLLGEQVTSTRLLALLEGADYLHYAGHARATTDRQGSALLLANAELEAWELFGLASVPPHVVLSACEAGQVSGSIGPGWGLAQVLLGLGASEVVAPLHRVNDQASLAVQRVFYKELGQRGSLREAFWATEQALEGSDPGAGSGLRLFVR